MVKADWFGEFEHIKEPVVVFEGNELYVNGIKIELGECRVSDIEVVQEQMDKIAEIISSSSTIVVYIPKEFELVTVYLSDFGNEVEVYYGDSYADSISEIVAIDYHEERYSVKFNSTFPVPEEIKKALQDAYDEDRVLFFAKRGDGNEKDRI